MLLASTCTFCNSQTTISLICANCWQKFAFINKGCHFCGYFTNVNDDFKCKNCPEQIEEYINQNISVFDYNIIGQKLILNFKNINTFYKLIPTIKSIVKINIKEVLKHNIDIITYVPTHWMKLLIRGYNQAKLIAEIVSYEINSEISNLLIKTTIRSQSSKNFEERKVGIDQAFKIQNNIEDKIKNKNILLVDDVMTTGSTLIACAKLLKQNGAKNVTTFTLARTGLRKFVNA